MILMRNNVVRRDGRKVLGSDRVDQWGRIEHYWECEGFGAFGTGYGFDKTDAAVCGGDSNVCVDSGKETTGPGVLSSGV